MAKLNEQYFAVVPVLLFHKVFLVKVEGSKLKVEGVGLVCCCLSCLSCVCPLCSCSCTDNCTHAIARKFSWNFSLQTQWSTADS